MNIKYTPKNLKEINTDLELIFIVNKDFKHKWARDDNTLKKLGFEGEEGQMELLPENGRIYVALESISAENLRLAAAEVSRFLLDKKYKSLKLGLYIDSCPFAELKALCEGLLLGAYKHDKYKSKAKKSEFTKIVIAKEAYKNKKIDKREISRAIKEATIISESVNFVRDLVNQTPEDVTPLTMSKTARILAKNTGLKLKVYGEKYLKDKKMGAFYAVSKASPYPPQLIHLIHKPAKAKKRVVLVGKGLTYDTGGLSLKPGDAMLTMKMDKAGGCAVFGVMKAVSEMDLPIEVHGIVGAVENAIGKHAYKPDDVLTAMNGKTIEVKNTDAEGRLVLADCLCYAQALKPDYMVDIATLTGACIVALGEYTIGVMGHNGELKNVIRRSAEEAGELTGDLPFNRFLPKLLKSDTADISNISSGRFGGAITAGLFLSEFIEKKNKDRWVHLDIAGPAFTSIPWGENQTGATGAGVRTIFNWLKQQK